MPSVKFGSKTYECLPGETILETLLRQNEDAPFSCKSGTCQSCLLKVLSGTPPDKSQAGLKASLVEQNYFLPCVAKAVSDLEVCLPDADTGSVEGRVAEITHLSDSVAQVMIELAGEFEFRAGQFINLVRDDGLVRSYSIASLPNQLPKIELHVRRIQGGAMSNWLYDRKTVGQNVQVRGPAGECFYMPQFDEQDLLLVGTGTGLAPLLGIVRDALQSKHRGSITLYHGALNETGLYHVDQVKDLSEQHERFEYHSCVLESGTSQAHLVGSLDQVVLDRHDKLAGNRVYLCGAPDFVNPMRKKVFLAGANSKQIHADAFLTSKPN